MVKKTVFALALLAGLTAAPRPALADGGACTQQLADCYVNAAKIDNFWYRTAAGIDCEIDYAGCVRAIVAN